MERLICRSGFCATAGALALAGGALFAPGAADAAVCMEHKMLVSYLTERFDETPRALGLVASRNVMEVYVSEKGTWTIVMTTTQGVACIVAAGDTWEDVKVALNEDPEY
jgi:hypothetical protein